MCGSQNCTGPLSVWHETHDVRTPSSLVLIIEFVSARHSTLGTQTHCMNIVACVVKTAYMLIDHAGVKIALHQKSLELTISWAICSELLEGCSEVHNDYLQVDLSLPFSLLESFR